MKPIPLALGVAVLGGLPLQAQLVGTENFTYPDGPITNLAGGIGFHYDNYDHVETTSTSDWDVVTATPNVVSGALVTNASSAKREYNGTVEGAGGTEGQDDTERSGALRGTGRVFYRFDIKRSAGSWSGASSYDFGAERVFFGVPGGTAPGSGVLEFGVQIAGGATYYSGIPADTNAHTLVAVLDFDRDFVGLWVDPDGGDAYDPATGANTADASGAYAGTNWSTAVRLGSGAQVTWDNLVVALDPASVGLSATSDGDGLPDPWEILHFGNLTQTDGGDPDGDGRTNLQEYNDGTLPENPDTDGDGLNDGGEQTAGTDPFDPDCDDDGLTDGQEVSTYGTDPFLGDTDSGGAGDFVEVTLATNPKVAGDDPTTNGNMALIGTDFFDTYPNGPLQGATGGSFWDYDNSRISDTFTGHTGKSSDWTNVTAAPQVANGRVLTDNSSIKREFHGGQAGQGAFLGESSGAFLLVAPPDPSPNASDVLYLKVQMTRRPGVAWSGLSLLNYDAERFFIGANTDDPDGAGPLPAGLAFALQESSNIPGRVAVMRNGVPLAPADGESHVIVAKFDFLAGTVSMFVDPVLTSPEPATADASLVPLSMANLGGTSVRLGSGGPAEWDGLVAATSWSALVAEPLDSDGDGMPDAYETLVGLDPGFNDASLDQDADGLSNLTEFLSGLAPNDPDSDNDGLNDGAEIAAHTNPFDTDTDNDGLSDGEEVNNQGTNPLLVDTDGDGQSDASELDGTPAGVTSSPVDPNATVGAPLRLIGRDDFTYADGAIAGLAGGSYFDYENFLTNGPFTGHTGVGAAWAGTATISGGALVTQGTAATRDFNAAVDGAVDARTLGAVNQEASHDASVVYFKIEMNRAAGAGLSLFGPDDFGTERLAFGVVDAGAGPAWGIRVATNIVTDAGALPVQSNHTYTLVGKLDFDGDKLSLWVDPNLGGTEASNPAQVTVAYPGTNWASGVKLSSDGTAATAWDRLVVANTWAQLAEVAPSNGLKLTVNGYNPATGMLSLSVSGIPATGTYHLTGSVDLQTFVPLTPPVDFTSATAQPFLIPVQPGTVPKRFFRAEDGPSAP